MLSAYSQRAGFLLLLIVPLEIFLGRHLEVFSMRPDLFIVLIVFWAFVVDRRIILQLALFLGFFRDIFSSGFFGVETLSYFLVGCLILSISLKIEKQSAWIRLAVLFLSSLVYLCIFFLINQLLMEEGRIPSSFWVLGLGSCIYTSVLGYTLMRFLENQIYSKQIPTGTIG